MGMIQKDADFGAETIPGLLVTDLTNAHGQDDRVLRLMADNAEQRVRIEKLQDMLHESQRLAASLSAQVCEIKGENATAQAGCQIVNVPFDCGYLVLEAQIEAGERATFDHPGDSGSIVPVNIFVNGRWLDVQDLHAALEHEALVEAIAEAKGES